MIFMMIIFLAVMCTLFWYSGFYGRILIIFICSPCFATTAIEINIVYGNNDNMRFHVILWKDYYWEDRIILQGGMHDDDYGFVG